MQIFFDTHPLQSIKIQVALGWFRTVGSPVPLNASFLLTINVAVGWAFAAAFICASRFAETRLPAWSAAGFLAASMTALAELLGRGVLSHFQLSLVSYASLSISLYCIMIGICLHYTAKCHLATAIGALCTTLLWHPMIIWQLERDSWQHAFAYQVPFFIPCIIVTVIVSRRGKRTSDFALLGVVALLAIQFLAKAVLAAIISTGQNPNVYAFSLYASVSQTIGAILSLGLGITLLSVILFGSLETHFIASRRDSLSGLLNRLGFIQAAEARRRTVKGNSLFIALGDLDNFKSVNDTYGHAAGDEAIRYTGSLIGEKFSDGDSGRFGGEEFIIVFSAPDLQAAKKRCEDFRISLERAVLSIAAQDVRVTISVGLTDWKPNERIDVVVFRADAALYKAKTLGRNQVRSNADGLHLETSDLSHPVGLYDQ